jgi:hypothetical protein
MLWKMLTTIWEQASQGLAALWGKSNSVDGLAAEGSNCFTRGLARTLVSIASVSQPSSHPLAGTLESAERNRIAQDLQRRY